MPYFRCWRFWLEEKKIFDNYYEIEKMMQFRVKDALEYAKQERFTALVARNLRSKRGLLILLISYIRLNQNLSLLLSD